MNRYLLFAYNSYYPSGGMDDCVFMSNDWDEVRDRWKKLEHDHSHVYDCQNGRQYSELEILERIFG